MRHLQKLLSTLIVADFARLTCSLEGSRLGPRNSTKWRETGRRWIGILATIYSSFLSSFHFSTFFSSREQKHCCSRACCFGVTLICILYCFPLPIILTEQTMAFTQSCHDFCLRSCNSVKRRRWGQRSAITATFFWRSCQSFAHSCRPAHQILHAGQLHLSLFCFCQPPKAISGALDFSALPSPGGDRMVDRAASLSLPQPLSNPLPLLPRLPYYPPILTTPLSPTNPLQWHHSLT